MSEPSEPTKKVLEEIEAKAGKRPKTVIHHILVHGFVTTRQLRDLYGYNHPPRAARDVKELGIPLVTFRTKDEDGKSIGAYKLGDLTAIQSNLAGRNHGRTALSRRIKDALLKQYGAKCFIHLEEMSPDLLQVDHRVPYEIAGEAADMQPEHFMLLCPAANREKSWACEHCGNWQKKDASFCRRCFWAHPEDYDHIAGQEGRHVHFILTGNLLAEFNSLRQGESTQKDWQDFLNRLAPLIENSLKNKE